ncbi:hypothetical protein ACP6PL_28955 [Dapis sp. BLCC M126]|uniref:hypothetical protein n=1 Tax=Dapis sp. BLCC M126 TaxID=3400189 RepID=UPI003CF16B40
MAASGDNFMYLSRVLGVIPPNPSWEGGELIPPNPPWEGGDRNLPASLEEYYQSLWQKMAGEGLSEIELGVLRVLVEQEETVSVEAISQFINVDEYDVEEVLETWLEFLHLQEIGGEILYSLYHSSFRNFLRICL